MKLKDNYWMIKVINSHTLIEDRRWNSDSPTVLIDYIPDRRSRNCIDNRRYVNQLIVQRVEDNSSNRRYGEFYGKIRFL